MEHNPWKTKKINPMYENPWIKVEHHDIINPAGNEGIYGKVHFKNRAMGIIPIDKDGNTWIIGQFRYALDEYAWEIPMGGGPLDEDKLESAKRELKEETGLIAEKWTEIMKIHTSNSVTDEVGFVYLAENLLQGETEFEETEVLKIKKLPFTEVLTMVMNGEITDGISIAGILKAARILNL
ncbi:NUDIX domain-containing protein [Algoriphagus antarcticus]|uniref:GDP-mannose pyrophosphatase n=1 Tax=Algoriphagus antarcticus TaxID=238540 RepID=A0A3E0DW80_9BACT|nr:NUDIX hydrolase [Algoriphagus antarcticus]REG90357.1 NUDIX domain-containing protein [Algoriphagus antarcticus]